MQAETVSGGLAHERCRVGCVVVIAELRLFGTHELQVGDGSEESVVIASGAVQRFTHFCEQVCRESRCSIGTCRASIAEETSVSVRINAHRLQVWHHAFFYAGYAADAAQLARVLFERFSIRVEVSLGIVTGVRICQCCGNCILARRDFAPHRFV